jgi:anionic cell wall polymer biosynthesis LytR-Cps2A-Psr (LCP) family protein
MTMTTKAVAWVGAILGTVSVAVLALIIGAMMYAGYRNAEQQRQQQEAATQLKQGLAQDLQNLSKMEVKPITEEDRRKWLSGAASPTGTPVK